MQTELPVYENPEEALKACIQALGGAKKVGKQLWPEKSQENARDYLLACVNADRNEKLTLSQALFIFREAKRIGFHAGMEWFAGDAEYRVIPVTQEEQVEAQTAIIDRASRELSHALTVLERLQNPKVRAA